MAVIWSYAYFGQEPFALQYEVMFVAILAVSLFFLVIFKTFRQHAWFLFPIGLAEICFSVFVIFLEGLIIGLITMLSVITISLLYKIKNQGKHKIKLLLVISGSSELMLALIGILFRVATALPWVTLLVIGVYSLIFGTLSFFLVKSRIFPLQ
jgi:hypothetical protein